LEVIFREKLGTNTGVEIIFLLAELRAQTFFPDLLTQVSFLPALTVVALSLMQDLFNNEVAEYEGVSEEKTNKNVVRPTDNFWYRFIL
jgi:hypothetical protein